MANITTLAKRCWRGLPRLRKELSQRISHHTGLMLATPTTYYVIFGGRCNARCKFCFVYEDKGPILPGEAMLRIVREAKALSGSGFNINISGGEPLIYEPIYDVLKLAHDLRVDVGFTSNGYLLTNDVARRIVEQDPFNINISLEAADPAVNELVRPMKNGTLKTLEGVENLVTEKRRLGSRVGILIKPTIMEQNYRALPGLVKHFAQYKEVQIHLQPFLGKADTGFWVTDPDALRGVLQELLELRKQGCGVILDESAAEDFVSYFRKPPRQDGIQTLDLKGRKRNCTVGLRTLFIHAEGEVHFCTLLRRCIGNVHQNSLSEIWYGDEANAQRQRMLRCNIDCQNVCLRPIPLSTKIRAFLRMG